MNCNTIDDIISGRRRNPLLERDECNKLDIENQSLLTRINREQIAFIWLDTYVANYTSLINGIRLTKKILRKLNDYVIPFTDKSKCLTYLHSIKNETVVMVVIDSCASSNLLDELRSIDSIFIFDQNKTNHDRFLFKKRIIGIFNEQVNLALNRLFKWSINNQIYFLCITLIQMLLNNNFSTENKQETNR